MADPTTTAPASGAPGAGNPGGSGFTGSTAGLVGKHGGNTPSAFGQLPPKPGSRPRGRPRLDGLPAGSGGSKPPVLPSPGSRPPPLPGSSPSGPSLGVYVAPPIDPALVARTVESVLCALDSVAVSVVEGKARKLIDDEKQVREVANSVRLSDTNRQLIATNLPIVLTKHGVSSEHLPELALAAGLAGYGSGFMVAVQKLDTLIKAKEAKEAAALAVQAP